LTISESFNVVLMMLEVEVRIKRSGWVK